MHDGQADILYDRVLASLGKDQVPGQKIAVAARDKAGGQDCPEGLAVGREKKAGQEDKATRSIAAETTSLTQINPNVYALSYQ